eukprot:Pgem_evm1s5841
MGVNKDKKSKKSKKSKSSRKEKTVVPKNDGITTITKEGFSIGFNCRNSDVEYSTALDECL